MAHESQLAVEMCIMIHVLPCGATTWGLRCTYTEAYSCTRKVATMLLDAMLLDLSCLGHNGLVHNAREAGWQLN